MAKWKIDTAHSDVHFRARYLVISSVTGEFKKFEGTAETPGSDFRDAKIFFSAEPASVDTNNAKRDEHLRGVDFFNIEKHPTLHFVSTGFNYNPQGESIMTGMLTIKTVTKPIELKVTTGGSGIDQEGKTRLGFEVEGHVNRYDYGLIWELITEAGAIVLGEDVKITANIQMVKESD